MSNLIELARELGAMLQTQPEYINYHLALQAHEEDLELQAKIETFEQLNVNLGLERKKAELDTQKLKELDTELRSTYDALMSNINVKNLGMATDKFKPLVDFVNQIINGSAQGLDPQTIQLETDCPSEGCGGCEGC